MKTAVIVDSVRTGLAKSHRGGFNMTRPDDMLAHIINGMLDRNPNLPPEMVEDVIMGCGNPEGAMGHNIGRNAAVLSNLPLTVGGTTVNRYCSSGLQSISMAASQIMAGCYDTVIAGGVEQITNVCETFNVFCRNNVSGSRTQIKSHRVKPNDLPMGVRDIVLCYNSIDFFGIIQVGLGYFDIIF